MIERILNRLFERHDIGSLVHGPYLTRWVVWGKRFGPGQKMFLHLFHRGDAEPYFHDHPWPFWSLILKGGYWEWTPGHRIVPLSSSVSAVIPGQVEKWFGPLRLLRRPAEWRHRVELPPGKRCWSLVWTGEKSRSWGFWCPAGWIPWRQHTANIEAGAAGCGEEDRP